MTASLTRRRFITVSAVALGLCLTAGAGYARTPVRRWRGVALGADAALTLRHPDPARADAIIGACMAEVRRLEKIFSLYRPDSALVRLNRDGRLPAPPLELVDLLGRAHGYAEATGGAFDVTVQPLWRLYAEHFTRPGADSAGPSLKAIEETRARVDFRNLRIEVQEIAFTKPGMALTLNGIAQGYITDRVADLLRGFGMTDVLVNMGETRALGGHPDGRPWRVGLENPGSEKTPLPRIDLRDAAIATSGGYGFVFTPGCRHHHILDPRTGVSPARWRRVSVIAADATTADALSTASMMLTGDQVASLSTVYDAETIALDHRGKEAVFTRG
ncbi:MAG: FAD:protein FMN transferase [Rhodospirillales bacterium]|nr:FAD:protein FMN transferase [Alphaproteobacteria bacterium]MBL6948611.1 FAD:protein FMN transferase [Rhodospirillales bacterium]